MLRGDETLAVREVADFERLLLQITGLDVGLSRPVRKAVADVIAAAGPVVGVDLCALQSRFYGLINQKLFANRPTLRSIYARAAREGTTFNYPAKKALAWTVDSADPAAFAALLESLAVPPSLVAALGPLFTPIGYDETKRLLAGECEQPSKLRRAHQRTVMGDVVDSSAGPLVWSLWQPTELHRHFGAMPVDSEYTGNFLPDLRRFAPALFERRRSLVIRHVLPTTNRDVSYEHERGELTTWLAAEFDRIDNYGFVSIALHCEDDPDRAWLLSADLTLFAERFLESRELPGFFRLAEVEAATLEHNLYIDAESADFSTMNEGLTYRDLFVLTSDEMARRLVLVFQKNCRDETLVPCPTCRSGDVRGNSYPTLGVKSWECRSPICPERSIYNRGKRYSFKGLLSQEAIEDPASEISVASVRRWQRDVLVFESDEEINETLIRHYSLANDPVAIIGTDDRIAPTLGRRTLESNLIHDSKAEYFWDSAFFHRFIPAKQTPDASIGDAQPQARSWSLVEGDAWESLRSIANDTFDRAITSPPYFNARDYAQWPNLYCYLYDMHRVSAEVFRTLKPGALYAFNIFDYFDNENTITFSAMGNKRIPLSALMVDVFRRVGFQFHGTIVWDKGEIEGKRGFNAGNFSPFYQSPFNCWEHVLVVRKPGAQVGQDLVTNRVVRISPVVKMIRGENTHGHTAPFPIDLPGLLLEGLPLDSVVLDPYGGSGTTARAAVDRDLACVLLERDAEYCELTKRLMAAHERRVQFAMQTLF